MFSVCSRITFEKHVNGLTGCLQISSPGLHCESFVVNTRKSMSQADSSAVRMATSWLSSVLVSLEATVCWEQAQFLRSD